MTVQTQAQAHPLPVKKNTLRRRSSTKCKINPARSTTPKKLDFIIHLKLTNFPTSSSAENLASLIISSTSADPIPVQPRRAPRAKPMYMNCAAKRAAILYHYPCPDGAFSALAAHLYFSATSDSALFFPNTVYSPLRAADLPLHQIDDVYLLDFVGPTGFVQEISSKVSRVIILDHHKTALETLGGMDSYLGANVHKLIDVNRSGATIAYDYFKEKLENNKCYGKEDASELVLAEYKRVRKLFEYIEDGDLWKWKLKDSKAFSSGLKDLNIEFNANMNPSLFDELLSLSIESIINTGKQSLANKQKLIDGILDQSFEIAVGGGLFGKCLAVIADSVPELRSELGHQLATKSQNTGLRGIGAVVYKVPELGNNDIVKISLRSIESEDTTPISQNFGGGGHRNASSFMLPVADFELWKAATVNS